MLSTELPNFADQLSHRYFIHTAPAQQLQAISVSPEATH
jgi:hypothetical protein